MGNNELVKTETIFNQFASDNYAGICPEAWRAMEQANQGFAQSYGEDLWTEKACQSIRELFDTDCQVFFVFNGTAANSLVLASLCRSYHSVICHEIAHIETDECGAPEFFSNGTKLLIVPGDNGKLDLDAVERTITKRTDITAISSLAKRYGLRLHMDGARFSNAVAALNVHPSEITWKAGVDVLCFGGAKNGMAIGEAVVFFNRELAEEFEYRCKQAGQLASKMRFMTAPWSGMLENGAWLRLAGQANKHAKQLEQELAAIDGISVMYPCQANSVFVEMPEKAVIALREAGWRFYSFIGNGGARFMCSWQTSEADVQQLVAAVRKACK